MTQQDRFDDLADDGMDDEPTLIARVPTEVERARRRADAASGEVRRPRSNRPISSFGPKRDGEGSAPAALPERPSLYERLLRSGALDEVMEVAAREQAELGRGETAPQSRPVDPTRRVVHASGVAPAASLDDLLDADEEPEARGGLPETSTPPPLPRNTPAPGLPSVVLGPGASSRRDSTDRVVLKEITERVLTESLTPRSATPSRPAPEQSRNYAPALAVTVLLLAGGSVAWWASQLPGDPPPSRQQAAVTEAVSALPPLEGAAEVVEAPAPQPQRTEEPQPEPELAAEPRAERSREDDESGEARRAARERRREERRQRAEKAPAADETKAEARPDAPKAESSASEAAETESVSREAAAAQAPSELPAKPSRQQVVQVMTELTPHLRECVGDKHGTVRLKLTVRGQGRVSYALVNGDFAGTPEGSCIARAVKEARFPRFTESSLQISYPIQL